MLAGIGMLSEHCTDQSLHGDMADKIDCGDFSSHPAWCNVGKGPQFWRFRTHTMKQLGVKDVVKQPLQVLISVRQGKESDRFGKKSMERFIAMGTRFSKELRPHAVKAVLMSTLIEEQVETAANSVVMVVLAGGGASTALWLPRGATLILLAPVDVKDDFVLWAHLSHVTVRWIEIGELNSPIPENVVQKLVEEGLARYSQHS